jgi:sugar phosphate isomerase/epimerase
MVYNRRNFLRTGLSGAAVAAIGGAALTACASKQSADGKEGEGCCGKEKKGEGCGESCCSAKLKISFQEGIAPGNNLGEKLDYMEKLGVVGFEPGGGGLAGRVDEIKQALNGRNIQVSAICAGFEGFILSTDPAIRQKCLDSMKVIISAAGELGSTGVIIVPGFNGQTPALPHTQETRDFLCEQFVTLGNWAVESNTTVIFEPLNRKEAFYLRQVADAASICRDVNNPGVRCMGDFWHMTAEETCDMGAFLSAGEYLQHVHIASRRRRSMPGEDGEADNYVAGFKALKMLGYDKYVSFECGCQGDRNVVVPAAVELLRKQWDEA